MNTEERSALLNHILQLRKKAELSKGTNVETNCIAQAEALEALVLTPLPKPVEIDGDMVPAVDLMLVNDFVEQVKLGAFNNYDGSGYYANDTHESRLLAIPSEIMKGKINKKFTHVAWYNK